MAEKDINQKIYVYGGLGLVAAYFLWNRIKAANKDKAGDELASDASSQQAALLRAAFNPSGASLLIQTDGTKNEAVTATAKQIKDFGKVAQAYKNLYNSNLSDDLTNELTAEELTSFFALVKGSAASQALLLKFKYGPGIEIKSNPKAGFARTAYYPSPKGATGVYKPNYWNLKAGSFMGKIVSRFLKAVKDPVTQKVTNKAMYAVNNVPLSKFDKANILYVFESDIKAMNEK